MAKPKHKLFLEKVLPKINTIKGLYRKGYSQEEIARKIGIAASTLIKFKKEYREVKDALSYERDEVDYLVESALLKNALEGDTKAQIYWLKNRQRETWCDNPENGKDSSNLDGLIKALEGIKEGK